MKRRNRLPLLKINPSYQPANQSSRPQTSLPSQSLIAGRPSPQQMPGSTQFNRLEALFMARTLDKEPIFQTVKVTPTHTRPVGSVKSLSRSTDVSLSHSPPIEQLSQICLAPNTLLYRDREPAIRPLNQPEESVPPIWIQTLIATCQTDHQ